MATTTTRINGFASQAGYDFYEIITIDDTIQSDNTFLVNIDAYIVNNGSTTNTNGWNKATNIYGYGEYTWTNQNLNTTGASRYGGETLAIQQHNYYRIPAGVSQIKVTCAMSKSSYASYDPGYCEVTGWVQMPKVQSTWNSSLLNIPNIETAFTLPINKYVNDYYNVVEVRNSNNTQLIKTINDAVNGTSVSFSNSELNTIYTMDNNANQLPLVFYMDLKTYTNSSKTTQTGTTQRLKCEAYIVNGEPTATYTIVEQDAKVIELLGSSTSDKIIQNASDLLFTITPTALKGATISSVKVNDTYATLDSGNYVLNITDLTTGTFNIVITDSRGLTKTYTATKTLLDYIACKINTWSVERESPVSSDLVLNANVNVWNSTINGNTNTIVVKYSIDNENWTTIPSSSYTITDNVLTISNLTLSNIIPYTSTTTFYLDISDLLSETKENYQISKGIETYSWGENDLQVNGEIFIADEEGENPRNVLEEIDVINSNLTTETSTAKTDIQSTTEQTLISKTLSKGTYLFIADIPINYYGASGREINVRLYQGSTIIGANTGVINTNAYTLNRPLVHIIHITNNSETIYLKVVSSTTARYDVNAFSIQILRLK